MSKLTDLQLKFNGMLYSGNVSTFQWYFTGPHVFDGILFPFSFVKRNTRAKVDLVSGGRECRPGLGMSSSNSKEERRDK